MGEDNIVKPKFGGSSLRARDTAGFSCRHRNVVVCRQSRIVECESCGTVLDPIQVLLEFAYQERALNYTEEKLKKAQQTLAEMNKEEVRLRARIKRANKKLKELEG